ncbi:hypothetical protein DIPPA_14321 [Diplonema papillatum]|nr:hypothetical protein DIPPA_14321 [Diplonema papillatum]
MQALRGASLLVFAVLATAQTKDCGNGVYVTTNECCVCDLGWERNPTTLSCTECAVGFFWDEVNNVCSNGRKNSPCSTGLEYPLWGCSIGGQAIGECSAGNKFPCNCTSGNCEQTVAERQTSCYPTGTRMYTSFPNQPLIGQAHSLTFVGCKLSPSDVYAVIPAYTDDLSMERTCGSLDTNYTAGGVIPPPCRFISGSQEAHIGNTSACDGSVGFSITNLREESKKPAKHTQGMSEFTFEPITIYEDVFRGTLEQKAAAAAAEAGKDVPIHEKETYFRVCKLVTVMTNDGGSDEEWQEVAGHDHQVEKRDFMYKVAKESIYDENTRAAAGMDGEDGESCCDGLKLGPICLPLWAFLLLWLLMACCLGAMGYSLHKNKNEIEAQKNNEKYEKFNVDAEMSAMAAKQAEDDDDI